jgi:hypothetical protein|tara:strand:+ start:40 stop:330 length:291 start_codon:yes stop_codon:yes gene_type:complete
MRFEYDFFVPEVGDLVIDGCDGAHGVVVSVGCWHTFAYFVEQGPVKILIVQVVLPEYNGITEQYSLKCIEEKGTEFVQSPLRFLQRDDITLLKTNM